MIESVSREAALEPCPFCGGEAEELELEDEANFGGSVICCTKCGASSAVHFDRKQNLTDSWNTRLRALPATDTAECERLRAALGEISKILVFSPPGHSDHSRLHAALDALDLARAIAAAALTARQEPIPDALKDQGNG